MIACCCGVEPGLTADLAIDKKLSFDDRVVMCTITVTNNGPNKAEDVVVTDTLGGVSIGQLGGFEPDQNWVQRDRGQPLVAELGSMDPGQVVQLRFQIAPRQLGVLTNKARVTSNTVDPNPQNNEVTRSIDLVSGHPLQADLGVKLDINRLDDRRTRIAIHVHNDGPSAVPGAVLKFFMKSDPRPFMVVTQGPEAPSGPWISLVPAQPQQSCQLDATLALLPPGQTEVLTVTLQRASRESTVVAVEANIEPPSGTTDPDPRNNTDRTSFDL